VRDSGRKRTGRALAALLVCFCLSQAAAPAPRAAAADALDAWVGEYTFDEDGGKRG